MDQNERFSFKFLSTSVRKCGVFDSDPGGRNQTFSCWEKEFEYWELSILTAPSGKTVVSGLWMAYIYQFSNDVLLFKYEASDWELDKKLSFLVFAGTGVETQMKFNTNCTLWFSFNREITEEHLPVKVFSKYSFLSPEELGWRRKLCPKNGKDVSNSHLYLIS